MAAKKSTLKPEAPSSSEAPKGRGRPRGKRSNPDFVQTTAYIRVKTYREIRIALLEQGEELEYSELVEELLSKWLKGQK
jgi:hypothetical protein